MIRKLLREFYLLSRGEQRAMLLLSLLVMFSLLVRTGFRMLPSREPPGTEQFRKEALAFFSEMTAMDSLGAAGTLATEGPLATGGALATKAADNAYSTRGFNNKPARRITPVNLNQVDSAGLLPLPGIGPVFAGRIVKYRKLLGGFVDTGQLLEVYGMKRETVERITPYIFIDGSLLSQINIDSASFRELLRHPYLDFDNVKAIVHYRDLMGHISGLDELSQNAILPDSVLEKVTPYLEISRGSRY